MRYLATMMRRRKERRRRRRRKKIGVGRGDFVLWKVNGKLEDPQVLQRVRRQGALVERLEASMILAVYGANHTIRRRYPRLEDSEST